VLRRKSPREREKDGSLEKDQPVATEGENGLQQNKENSFPGSGEL
jgi:hypothetical protein